MIRIQQIPSIRYIHWGVFMTQGKAVFGKNKKGVKSSFQKKLGGEDFLTKNRGKDFFQKKNKGSQTFLTKKGAKTFFQANFAKTRPRYPINFDRSLSNS